MDNPYVFSIVGGLPVFIVAACNAT